MKRVSAIALLSILVCATLAIPQAPPQPPKPGPEHKRLNYFAGTWKLEGDMKPSPYGPGGKFLGKEHNEWMEGGFFLVSHSDETSPMGKGTGLAVMGYDPNDKVYTYHAFNSMGDAEDAKGTFDDGTWTWTSDSKMGGKVMKGRFTVKETSPTSYTFKYEMSSDGGEWSSVMEGKGAKAK